MHIFQATYTFYFEISEGERGGDEEYHILRWIRITAIAVIIFSILIQHSTVRYPIHLTYLPKNVLCGG